MDFYKCKNVAPYWLFVFDLQKQLCVSLSNAKEIGDELWIRVKPEYKDIADKLKEEIRSEGSARYRGTELPQDVVENYFSPKARKVQNIVMYEKANGVGSDTSDIDHYFTVLEEVEHC